MHSKVMGLATFVLVAACGNPPPTTPSPVAPPSNAPPGGASEVASPKGPIAPASSSGEAQTSGSAFKLLSKPTCVLEGKPGSVRLELHGKTFAALGEIEWAEVQIVAGQPTATIVGRAKRMDFAGEIPLSDVVVAPRARVLRDGWFAIQTVKLRDVSPAAQIVGTTFFPRVLARAPAPEITHRCDEVALGAQPWTEEHRGTHRVFKFGAAANLLDHPGGRVLGRIEVPARARPDGFDGYFAWVLEERAQDVRILVGDRSGATIEGWVPSATLMPSGDRDAHTLLIAAQASEMQVAMLAALGVSGPAERTCKKPLSVYVRDGGSVFPIGAIRPREVIPRATAVPKTSPDEVPVSLGATTPTSALVPFVLASALANCNSDGGDPGHIAVPGRGLVAAGPGTSMPPSPGQTPASTPPAERKVDGPRGDVQLGAMSASIPVKDADRVVQGLRPRYRQCYQLALNGDPSVLGNVVLQAKLAPTGGVISVEVLSNSGLPAQLTVCAGNVTKRAEFSPPGGGGSTLTIPLAFTKPSP
jgi:hypothetical protein